MHQLKRPFVSVVIPCYNGGKFIMQAIESVLNQSYSFFEIIVVDDGSIDASVSAIRTHFSDSRIKVLEHGSNKGIPTARNSGLKASQGELVAFLDQDDLWFPEKLAEQVNVFLSNGSDLGMVFTNLLIKEGEILRPWPGYKIVPKNIRKLSAKNVLERLLMYNFIVMSTVMIRREIAFEIGLFDEYLKGGADDLDFFLRVLKQYKAEYIPRPLVIKTVHRGCYSNLELFIKDHERIMTKMLTEAPFLRKAMRKKKALDFFRLGRYYQDNSKYILGLKAFAKSLYYKPANIRCVLALMLCMLGPMGSRIVEFYRAAKAAISACLDSNSVWENEKKF